MQAVRDLADVVNDVCEEEVFITFAYDYLGANSCDVSGARSRFDPNMMEHWARNGVSPASLYECLEHMTSLRRPDISKPGGWLKATVVKYNNEHYPDGCDAPPPRTKQAQKMARHMAQKLAQKDAKVAQTDAAPPQKDAKVAQKDAKVAQKHAKVAQTDAAPPQKDAKVAQKDAKVAQKDADVAADDHHVAFAIGLAQDDDAPVPVALIVATTDVLTAKGGWSLREGNLAFDAGKRHAAAFADAAKMGCWRGHLFAQGFLGASSASERTTSAYIKGRAAALAMVDNDFKFVGNSVAALAAWFGMAGQLAAFDAMDA